MDDINNYEHNASDVSSINGQEVVIVIVANEFRGILAIAINTGRQVPSIVH